MTFERKNSIRIIYPLVFGMISSLIIVFIIYKILIQNEYINININGIINNKSKSYINGSAIYKIISSHVLILIVIILASLLQVRKYIYSLLLFTYGFRIGFVIFLITALLGIKGILCGILCYFPHEFIYIFSNILGMYKLEKYYNMKNILDNIKEYICLVLLLISLTFIGVLGEIYINPAIISWI